MNHKYAATIFDNSGELADCVSNMFPNHHFFLFSSKETSRKWINFDIYSPGFDPIIVSDSLAAASSSLDYFLDKAPLIFVKLLDLRSLSIVVSAIRKVKEQKIAKIIIFSALPAGLVRATVGTDYIDSSCIEKLENSNRLIFADWPASELLEILTNALLSIECDRKK